MSKATKTGELELIQYYREKKPPSLKQFVHRKHVSEIMTRLKGADGIERNPSTGRNAPVSAIKARELLKGKTSEYLIAEHPEWVEEYRKEYPNAAGNKEA